jgi:hypothetical protein
LPLAGGTMTGDIYAAGRSFTFQDLLLGAGTTFGKITTDGSKYISIMPTYNVESARFWSNGNVTIQDAGTYVDNGFRLDVSGSGRFTNGLTVTGSLNVTNGITGSLLGTASQALSSSYAETASFANNLTVAGTLTAQTIVAQTITSSIDFVTGSTKNGSLLTNTHEFTGSVGITGSLAVNGSDYITTSGSTSTRLTSLESFSGVYSTGSFTGSFNGRVTGSFSGSLYNLQNDVLGHIPFFSSSQVLADSVVRQLDNGSGSYSIVINQDNITTAAPEALYVYQPSATSYNVIAGKGNLNSYLQLNIQNTNTGENASSDVVATANNGNESVNYIDMGINSEGFTGSIGDANDAYLYSTGNHLHIGNASNQYVGFFAGGHDVDTNMKLILSPDNRHEITGSLTVTEKLNVLGGVTASLQGTASVAVSSSYAATASYANNFTVAGTLTAQTINVQTITSSIEFNTGSTRNGSTTTNTHQFTGSVLVTGSTEITGSVRVRGGYNQSGTDSNLFNGSTTFGSPVTINSTLDAANGFQVSANAARIYNSASIGKSTNPNAVLDVNGSVLITGSLVVTQGITGSLQGTASYATQALSASYWSGSVTNATTASYVQTAQTASYVLNAVSASYALTSSYLNPIENSYLVLSQVSQSLNFADDTAAASGGVPLGGLYRNGNFILIRIV